MEKGKAILENNPTKLRVRIDTNTTVSPPNQQEWQVVRRKRRYPDHWRPGGLALLQADQLPRTQPYVPFQTRPTYAQILANPSPAVHPTSSTTHSTTPPTSPPTSPHSPTYYLSPHSPTPLRFPPSAKFSEWKGRCFRCCRTGHSIATCRNPPKCGRYWKSGHTGSRCRSENTKQVTLPAGSPGELRWVQGTELGFDELLAEPKPLNPPPMPEGRPQMLTCFVDRDPQFYHEMNRLHNAVVVHTAGLAVNFDLSVDKVAEWVAESKILPATDVTIAALTKKRFLIMLPPGLALEVLIQAIPYELWEEGLSFKKWDPLEDAATIRPEFKTMVELSGIPPHMYREKAVINALLPGTEDDEDELVPMSCRWLIELCKDRDLDTLPPSIRAVVTGEDRAGLAGGGIRGSATQPVITENWASDSATRTDDETGHGMAWSSHISSPISPILLRRESESTSGAVAISAEPVTEKQEMVRGINCSDANLSGGMDGAGQGCTTTLRRVSLYRYLNPSDRLPLKEVYKGGSGLKSKKKLSHAKVRVQKACLRQNHMRRFARVH
ncbi:hypothetical protein FCM35_KLT06366 [Carex littledalei]|uniref:CCHC-type domain-containing protein n=1 Tax=Carex littledalei TaxID=544730 RepID=A0A833QJE0_9POAL|nr:hypothetical protein FCM35_KLT06366 [Carex littledalei]